MKEPGPDPEPTPASPSGSPTNPGHRLVGLGGLLRALHNLGLLRRRHAPPGPALLRADDGQAVYVRRLGARQRPTSTACVVLLHGLGCTHAHWMPVARRLARRAPVLAWDARCHGASAPAAGTRATLQRLGDDLRQLLDHDGIGRAVLVGHSMGALTVLQYLQRHGTDRVQAVALVDQSPRIVTDADWRCGIFGGCRRDTLLELIGAARQDLPQTLRREIETAGFWPRHGSLQRVLERALRRWLEPHDASALLDLAQSLVDADFRALLARLDRPLWVALGGRSPHYGGVPLADYYRRTVPHASVTVYPSAGHSPHVSDPARVARDLQRFIDDHA